MAGGGPLPGTVLAQKPSGTLLIHMIGELAMAHIPLNATAGDARVTATGVDTPLAPQDGASGAVGPIRGAAACDWWRVRGLRDGCDGR
jgi:hypothetical protein